MPIYRVHRRRSGLLLRAGVVALTLLASSTLGMPSAGAAPAVVIPLDPPSIAVFLGSPENDGGLTVDTPLDAEPTFTPVPAEWGGGVTVQIPDLFDGGAMEVTLDLYADLEDVVPMRTYSTAAAPPDQMVVTDLGTGQYGVALPADDGVSGPLGVLTIDGVTSSEAGIEVTGPMYVLEFTGTGVSVQNLVPQVIALATLPCVPSGMSCPAATVRAGGSFGLTVPPDSLLRALDLGTLDDLALALHQFDGDGYPVGEPLMLTDQPGQVSITDPYNAVVNLPASTPAGSYGLTLLHSSGTASVSITFGDLLVEAIPAPRLQNAGLHSNTGWTDPVSLTRDVRGAGTSPTVAVGLGMMTVAGVVTVAVLRPRRRAGTGPCAD